MVLKNSVFSVACLVLSAAAPFQLTVDSIMRGPGLVGYEPRAVRWSGNSQRVYFEWKLATDSPVKSWDTYAVNRDGSGLRKLSHEEARFAAPESGDTTRDQRFTVYTAEDDIYLYDHAADKSRMLTRTSEKESEPHFLRDGKRIAFTRASNLYVMALDGMSLVQMTDIYPHGAPAPPEEKKGTALQEYLKKQERDLLETVKERAAKREEDEARKKKENPRKPLRLKARESIEHLQLSPDETTVIASIVEEPESAKTAIVPSYVTESAYTESIKSREKVGDVRPGSRMMLISVETGEVKHVETNLKRGDKDRELNLEMPQWSDDGAKAFLTALARDNKDWWILALDAATGCTRVITTLHDDAWVRDEIDAGWMKNSKEIFFRSERDGFSHLYTISHEGGEPRQLTSGRWELFDVELSPDKKRFHFHSNEEHFGERHLYAMDAGGGPRRKLTTQTGRHQAAVSPDGQSIADVYSYVNRPPELYVREVKVTNAPIPEFWSYKWRDAPIVQIPARDGMKVPGRLYTPSKAVKGGGPAVIFVHGAGYLQNIHKGWSNYYREYMFHHLLAERGYTVLDIDYRGSAGYGRDWRTAIYRHMGGKDLDDQVDAAKWLVSAHGVDPKRIGIYGGSYGGFITLMAMFTQPEVFAAGAALRPVTDWAHYNHEYTSNILNVPQEDSEAYKKSSPIYFADGLRGALLLCHGMADVNVHAQDTIRLAQRLIELRKENWEMALYPVEDHAFVQPTSWADEYKRILKLFESNLK